MTTATDRTVRVTASIAQAAPSGTPFGRTLYLVQDNSTPTTAAEIAQQRSRRGATVFANAESVNEAYPAGSSQREGAAAYFQAQPYPQDLVIGGQIAANQRGYVFGTALPVAATIQALGNGVALVLGGTSVDVDFGSATTHALAAAGIQAALRAARFDATTTVTVVSGALVVSTVHDDDIGTGFDNSAAARTLGLFGNDVQVFPGRAGETAVEALDRIQTEDDSWYYVALDQNIYDTATVTEVADWVSARVRVLALDSTQGAALTPNETTSFLAQVVGQGQRRVIPFWHDRVDHPALVLVGVFSSIDYERAQSVRTAKFTQLPGVTPAVLTPAQIDELTRKRVNFYTRQHGIPIVAEGTTAAGWIDETVWLDWFVDKMRRDIFAELVAGRIPQTESGMATLLDAVTRVCELGVFNGGIGPGQLSSTLTREVQQVTGNRDFDGFLTTGYLVHAGSIASQSLADRQARIAPPLSVWVKGSGALQRVDIAILFEG